VKQGLLTYIVTVYNKERYIKEVLHSIESQSVKCECEYIIVDDGSTDDSLKIIKDVTKDWLNCKVVSKANGGVVDAVISGIKAANGEYIKFVDGDDLLLPGIVAAQLDILIKNESLSYVSCSFGQKIEEDVYSFYRRGCRVFDGKVKSTDVHFFSKEKALLSIMTRKGGFSESLTGMSGGLSRASSIEMECIEELVARFKLKQMQDHLISVCSLLKGGGYAFLNFAGFLELSKATKSEREKGLSSQKLSGIREQVLINSGKIENLSSAGCSELVKVDLKRLGKLLGKRSGVFSLVNPFSFRNNIRYSSEKGLLELYYRLLCEVYQAEK
jgi:glycosyltransferase involved in cell wall biosynthesis